MLIAGIVAAAVILSGVGIALAMSGRSGVPSVAETRTTVKASPTPTASPAARAAGSAFLTALPSTVLQYAWATVAPDTERLNAGAVEAYAVVYTDGAAAQVTLRAGQWASAAEATAAQASIVAALKATAPPAAPAATATPAATAASPTPSATGVTEGSVTVGGQAVGTWVIVPAAAGPGTVVWSNGTALFEATAPVADLVNLYAAFPL
jgi:hypothetical protein